MINYLNKTLLISRVYLLCKNKKHNKGLSITGAPYSTKLKETNDGYIQLRIYGSNGYAYCDYDFNDHNRPKYHNFPKYNGAHKHYFLLDENNKPYKHDDAEELTEEEYNLYVKPYINNSNK